MAVGFMKAAIAFMLVVLPLAVSPHMKTLIPSLSIIHMYAAILSSNVPQLMSWVTLIGTLATRLMVKLLPWRLTSLP
ncbi:hypothetical protein D1872_332050 [compost metagenome]